MNSVSQKQLSIMIFFIPLVFKMSSLPALLYREAASTAYILIALITSTEFLQLALVLYVSNIGGAERLKDLYGAKTYCLVTLPMLFIVFIKMLVLTQEIAAYVGGFLFYNLPQKSFVPLLFLVVFYLGTRGARAVGRCFELSIWFILLIAVLGIFFGKAEPDFSYLTPLFTQSPSSLLRAAGKYLIFTFDFSPLLFFDVKIKRPAPIVLCSMLSVLSVTVCYALFFCSYGNASGLAGAAFARLATFNTVISEIGSLDWPGVLLWLTTSMLSLSLKIAAVDRISATLRLKKAGTALFVFVTWAVTHLALPTLSKAMSFVTSGVQYAVFGAEILLPLVLLLLIALRARPTLAYAKEC